MTGFTWRATLLGPVLGPLLGLTACAATPQQAQDPLAWLDQADPRRDAMAALEKRDFRLLALPRRSLVIPGIDPQRARDYELKCGLRILEGAGDAVHSRDELERLKQAREYAEAYNRIVRTRCNP